MLCVAEATTIGPALFGRVRSGRARPFVQRRCGAIGLCRAVNRAGILNFCRFAGLLRFAGGRVAFLLGRRGIEGWWWFFPYAWLVKTPLATLALLGLAAWVALSGVLSAPAGGRGARWREAVYRTDIRR